MTARTRYFVIASLLVLFAGVGTGLVAYYAGLPELFGTTQTAALDDLKLLPADSRLVAYANVRDVMDSELRQKVRNVLPFAGEGQREIFEQTGIDIEKDIDRLVVALASTADGRSPMPLVLARGVFDTSRIEGLMRQHGATIEEYKDARLIVANAPQQSSGSIIEFQPSPDAFTVSFIAPGMVAIGGRSLVKSAVDRKSGGAGVTENEQLMSLIKSYDGGDMWAVGRFDALTSGPLPQGFPLQLPAITWFAASADIDTGVRGSFRADTSDAEAAENLREVVRGFVALGKLQAGAHPELKGLLDSLTLGGTGNTVSLSFEVPPAVIDLLSMAAASHVQPTEPK